MIDRSGPRSSANCVKPRVGYSLRHARTIGLCALLPAASGNIAPALAEPLACDDGIKTAFVPTPIPPLLPSGW
jgi:hypothetical protein